MVWVVDESTLRDQVDEVVYWAGVPVDVSEFVALPARHDVRSMIVGG